MLRGKEIKQWLKTRIETVTTPKVITVTLEQGTTNENLIAKFGTPIAIIG
jgi:hypothetical protein